MAWTWCFHCQGHESNLWLGTQILHVAQCSQKTKTNQRTTIKNVQCNSGAQQRERITCAAEVGKKGCDYIGVTG